MTLNDLEGMVGVVSSCRNVRWNDSTGRISQFQTFQYISPRWDWCVLFCLTPSNWFTIGHPVNIDSNGYFAIVFLLVETAYGSAWSYFQPLLTQTNQIGVGELNLDVYIPWEWSRELVWLNYTITGRPLIFVNVPCVLLSLHDGWWSPGTVVSARGNCCNGSFIYCIYMQYHAWATAFYCIVHVYVYYIQIWITLGPGLGSLLMSCAVVSLLLMEASISVW